MLRFFAQHVVAEHPQAAHVRPQVDSMNAMCEAALAWVAFSRRRTLPKARYLQLLQRYMACRQLAYPEVDPKPKLHYASHLAGEVDCFPLERKHKQGILHGGRAVSASPLAWQRHVVVRGLLDH